VRFERSSALALSLFVCAACGGNDGATDAAVDGTVPGLDGGGLDGGSTDAAITPDASGGDDGGTTTPDGGLPTSAGCVDGDGLADGEHTFTLEGRMRRFILRLPMGYTRDRAWPLVLALHGNGGSASYWDGTTGDRNIRGVLENDAILIVAEAIDGNWRDYDMPEDKWPARVESELLYFEEVLTRARAELCVRLDGIFAMGFSGGGSFSGVLGCRRTDIRAIAVGGSVIYFDEADCVGVHASWITIGTMELTGGRTDFRDFFRDRAGCADTSMATDPDPPCVAYDGCGAATPVHYCQHPDGHIWPALGSQAMWDFFSALL
jgi:poly(3-hydroxybutyrate) depolymerase